MFTFYVDDWSLVLLVLFVIVCEYWRIDGVLGSIRFIPMPQLLQANIQYQSSSHPTKAMWKKRENTKIQTYHKSDFFYG